MKKIILLLLLNISIFVFNCEAQAPNWQWAKKVGGANIDDSYSSTTDNSGNLIITGTFDSPSINFGSTTITNAGSNDLFVAKYDGNGNFLWVRYAGGINNDNVRSCTSDINGNIIITGIFQSPSISFGAITLNNTDLLGAADIFIVKYDTAGTVLWAKSGGAGTTDEMSNSCTTDASGNIIITGMFYCPSFTIDTVTLNQASSVADVFVFKFDTNGSALWAKAAGGTSDDWAQSISADMSGNIFVTGYFTSSLMMFDAVNISNPNFLTNQIFVAKYDPMGNVLWAKSEGGMDDERSNSCSVDYNGNVFITGVFEDSVVTFGTTILTNTTSNEIFIIKYNPSGNILWAKNAGGTSGAGGVCSSVDSYGNFFVGGWYYDSTVTFGTTTLTNIGSYDSFIVKYDSLGNVIWAKDIGGVNEESIWGCPVTTSGDLFVTGYFSDSSMVFGSFTIINTGPPSTSEDIFIAKLNGINGIQEISSQESPSLLFPNPSTSSLTIRTSNSGHPATITIYNVLGEEVLQSTINNRQSTITIDVSGLKNGIYFIETKTGESTLRNKFVKQ